MARIILDFEQLGEKIKQTVEKTLINNIKRSFDTTIRDAIEDEIDQTVIDNRELFIPDNQQAGELGIGDGGSIDEDKRARAWEHLTTFDSESSVVINTNIATRRGVGTVVEMSIGWDREAFYDSSRCIVQTEETSRSEAFDLPWMQWFLQGETIGGSQFISGTRRARQIGPQTFLVGRNVARTSRTGRGIMIKGGVWNFRGTLPDWPERLGKIAAQRVQRRLEQIISAGGII